MPPLNLGQQGLVIILKPDQTFKDTVKSFLSFLFSVTWSGHGGVGNGHDLVSCADGLLAATVSCVVDPAVLKSSDT